LDFAAHSVRGSKDWLASHSLDFVQRYKSGELEIVLNVIWGTGTERHEYHLVFSTVPLVLKGHLEKSSSPDRDLFSHEQGKCGDNGAMFVSVTCLIDCAEDVIPSVIRLETNEQGLDLIRQICTSSESAGHFVERASERESAIFRVTFPDSDGNRVRGVIESAPEILDEFSENISDVIKLPTEFANWFDFMNFMVGLLRVRIDNTMVGVTLNESRNLPIEIKEVLLRSIHLAM